jgi:hypothetical protein
MWRRGRIEVNSDMRSRWQPALRAQTLEESDSESGRQGQSIEVQSLLPISSRPRGSSKNQGG